MHGGHLLNRAGVDESPVDTPRCPVAAPVWSNLVCLSEAVPGLLPAVQPLLATRAEQLSATNCRKKAMRVTDGGVDHARRKFERRAEPRGR